MTVLFAYALIAYPLYIVFANKATKISIVFTNNRNKFHLSKKDILADVLLFETDTQNGTGLKT